MATARRRLACADCTRRKIKCDKEIPCSNCIKSYVFTPPLEVHHGESAVVETLSKRIAELEARLNSTGAMRPSMPAMPAPGSRYVPPLASSSSGLAHTDTRPRQGSEIEDAASILEFLAWGRMKNPDHHEAIQPKSPAAGAPGAGGAENAMSELQVLQLHLPDRRQVCQLVDWHLESLLWYHGSFHAPTFRSQLQEFYDTHNGSILSSGISLQWAALLFSVLAGSLTCANRQIAQTWGFMDTEQDTLSHRWYQGTITCLYRGEYMAHYSLDSVEAIATLTISAHMIGYSNQQSILLASAIKISQSLGLHRLGPEPAHASKRDFRGRRVWAQLCTQDWFSIPFSESYLIQPLHSNTEKPGNRNDDSAAIIPDSQPTILSYPRYLLEVAYVMPQLQDAVGASNTLYTKYEQVLRYDKQMRALATAHRPQFLSNVQIDPAWPHYVPWARRALAISYSHKICMIHRAFLGLSFTNPAFSITRRTCIAAAKTILKEHTQAVEEDGPVLWIYPAFSVAACIILCLDVFHRTPEEPETSEHKLLVEESIEMLKQYNQSAIAARGVKLLSELLEAIDRSRANSQKRRAGSPSHDESNGSAEKRRRFLDMPKFVKSFWGRDSQPSASGNEELQLVDSGDDAVIDPLLRDAPPGDNDELRLDFPSEDLYGTFPLSQAPFDGASTFEQLLFLAGGFGD
ncbi:uncharacterized protein BDZ99DRAFT_540148 [Mytilinidion resinicola]|uniref:Zn(2)-C6 fungal-type domain-containing protein n=1 Tax=Mytilinidion resinicola TaxID=574789 RepID=A0A6A6YA78_9PEZI|nr:uncharacterized protein BDZ99DRAFT_540148 [Mytilinidion resinicola]KAF2805610.1 hypothetical protein BDZ99DRAFT_540148 [Mytilinidion resinicola]